MLLAVETGVVDDRWNWGSHATPRISAERESDSLPAGGSGRVEWCCRLNPRIDIDGEQLVSTTTRVDQNMLGRFQERCE